MSQDWYVRLIGADLCHGWYHDTKTGVLRQRGFLAKYSGHQVRFEGTKTIYVSESPLKTEVPETVQGVWITLEYEVGQRQVSARVYTAWSLHRAAEEIGKSLRLGANEKVKWKGDHPEWTNLEPDDEFEVVKCEPETDNASVADTCSVSAGSTNGQPAEGCTQDVKLDQILLQLQQLQARVAQVEANQRQGSGSDAVQKLAQIVDLVKQL